MLLALSRQFDLKVAGRQVVDKVSCLVLDGDRRQSKAGDDTGGCDGDCAACSGCVENSMSRR